MIGKCANGFIVRIPMSHEDRSSEIITRRTARIMRQEMLDDKLLSTHDDDEDEDHNSKPSIKTDMSTYVFAKLADAIGFVKYKLDGGE